MPAADFETWYREQHPALLASLTLMTGAPDVARDAVDEALARALERWDRVRMMDSPGGWTYRVAVNCLRRHERRAAMERVFYRRRVDRHDGSAPSTEFAELVRDLPIRQRQVVVLRYVADLPQAEIARVLGIRRSTVSSTLTHAHRALALLIESEEAPCYD